MSFLSSPQPPKSYATAESSTADSAELKLYQALIFSFPILFIFIILFLFYFFYLRGRRVDWSSIRMRTSLQENNNDISRAEMGLKKELREMLPIIIYKESFCVRDTQCSVCLGDYQAEDKLQQIPACGHAFHMVCIDHWLATHTTCPLCRLSLLASAWATSESPGSREASSQVSCVTENTEDTSDQPRPQEETQAAEHSDLSNEDARTLRNSHKEEGDSRATSSDTEKHYRSRGIPSFMSLHELRQ